MKALSGIWLFLACVTGAYAADWPMWRYDAARSAASPNDIATHLTILWSRRLPPMRPAWPLEVRRRLDFDASYEPVVMGNSLIPADGLVNVPRLVAGCVCNRAIQTSFAMIPMPEVEAWSGATSLAVMPPPDADKKSEK